jgi:hypothetical protein
LYEAMCFRRTAKFDQGFSIPHAVNFQSPDSTTITSSLGREAKEVVCEADSQMYKPSYHHVESNI